MSENNIKNLKFRQNLAIEKTRSSDPEEARNKLPYCKGDSGLFLNICRYKSPQLPTFMDYMKSNLGKQTFFTPI